MKLSNEEKLEKIDDLISEHGCCDESEVQHQIEYHKDNLIDNYKAVMKTLDEIGKLLCLSDEEMEEMFPIFREGE